MAPRQDQRIVIADLSGGRNDTDPPMSLRADQAVEMLNVDQKDTPFARKRGGAVTVSLSGGTAFDDVMRRELAETEFRTGLSALRYHVTAPPDLLPARSDLGEQVSRFGAHYPAGRW